MNIDTRALRNALGQYATGIAVVATRDADGRPVGLTVNSFASVSLDPPLVLWSLALTSAHLATFRACSHFAVNVLAADQQHMSQRFAMTGNDKFAALAWTPGRGGAPLLEGCCARFECRSEVQHPGGDHLILVGRVEAFDYTAQAPLLFHGGQYRIFDAAA